MATRSSSRVGVDCVRLNTMPRSLTAVLPSLVTVPPSTAERARIEVGIAVLIVGGVGWLITTLPCALQALKSVTETE